MTQIATVVTLLLMMGFATVLCLDQLKRRTSAITIASVVAVVFSVAGLHVSFGFPVVDSSVAFGQMRPTTVVLLLLGSITLGTISRFFYNNDTFAWLGFLRPIFIAPMLMMPLMGTVEAATRMDGIELASLAFLAFQNGFFWRSLLEKQETMARAQDGE